MEKDYEVTLSITVTVCDADSVEEARQRAEDSVYEGVDSWDEITVVRLN